MTFRISTSLSKALVPAFAVFALMAFTGCGFDRSPLGSQEPTKVAKTADEADETTQGTDEVPEGRTGEDQTTNKVVAEKDKKNETVFK